MHGVLAGSTAVEEAAQVLDMDVQLVVVVSMHVLDLVAAVGAIPGVR